MYSQFCKLRDAECMQRSMHFERFSTHFQTLHMWYVHTSNTISHQVIITFLSTLQQYRLYLSRSIVQQDMDWSTRASDWPKQICLCSFRLKERKTTRTSLSPSSLLTARFSAPTHWRNSLIIFFHRGLHTMDGDAIKSGTASTTCYAQKKKRRRAQYNWL